MCSGGIVGSANTLTDSGQSIREIASASICRASTRKRCAGGAPLSLSSASSARQSAACQRSSSRAASPIARGAPSAASTDSPACQAASHSGR